MVHYTEDGQVEYIECKMENGEIVWEADGFLTGVMSAFVSDFIFGMGQWTPWQMFAFGLAGFLAGFFVEKGVLKKERFPVCIFGGLVVILLVGPILDTSTFL